MKRNKLVALLCALSLLLSGCSSTAGTSSRHTVTLVAKSTQTEFWLSVFAGAEAAAAEYNLELSIAGPETEEDYETQNRLIAEAVRAGAEAIVFSAIDQEENAAAIDAAARAGQYHALHSSISLSVSAVSSGTMEWAPMTMVWEEISPTAQRHPWLR